MKKGEKELINMETVCTSPDVMLDFVDVNGLRVHGGSRRSSTQLQALPFAVLAPSIVYSLDFFQSMSGDEPNSEIPLC